MIKQEVIESILSVVRIEEVIGEFVSLKKAGNNYRGLCPFHSEKTPSFYVSPAKEIYKCFGCQRVGNAVNFLMEHEKYTYPEALKYLAAKYNIPVEETFTSEEAKKEKEEQSSIFIILNYAQQFFHDYLLNTEEGVSKGLEYFKSRGITHETIKIFGLGMSPSEKDLFTRNALQNGYLEKYLIDSGMSVKTNDGRLIDRFRERVMFPIYSITGRVLGFGGRVLGKATNEAKYINSPETPIFSKGKNLYGLNLAKNSIQKNDKCYLVEGYTDVIALYQQGFDNVVASLGTSLTEDHTRLIKRYTNNLTFIFDGDEAGIKASLRGIDIALKEEINTRIIALPENEDPDSFTKKFNVNDVRLFFKKNETDFILFKTRFLFGNKTDEPLKKAEVVRNIIKSIIQIPNFITRSNYIKELSYELSIEEDILYRELNAQLSAQKTTVSVKKSAPAETTQTQELQKHLSSTVSEQEKNIIRLLIAAGNMDYNALVKCADIIFDHISDTKWEIPEYENIYNYFFSYRQEKKDYPDIKHFIHHPDKTFQQIAAEVSFIDKGISENWSKKTGREVPVSFNFKSEIDSALKHFTLRKYQSMLKENAKKLREKKLTVEEEQHYQEVQKAIQELLVRLTSELGVVIF
ncbi:MAG: DNA primase [Sphingobacteriales bacterium]|nr:DNA primase [Sphingobacteriales bacterium]